MCRLKQFDSQTFVNSYMIQIIKAYLPGEANKNRLCFVVYGVQMHFQANKHE